MNIDDPVGKKQYHYAIVTRVEDDKLKKTLRGAVFIKSDTLTNGTEWPDPIEPSFPLAGKNGEGFFWVPQVGDQIEIEIDLAVEHPVPKYIRMLYSDVDDIAEEFKVNYPFRMGWKTRVGHILLFDNKEEAELVKFAHKLGTGFTWDKDGNEIKTIIGDLKETIEKNVLREIKGQVTELFKAEVKRTYDAKVNETYKKDLVLAVQSALKMDIKKEFKVDAQEVKILAKVKMVLAGKTQTDVGDPGGITNIFGSVVALAGGGLPVALVGSTCIGVGNLGAPVVSAIVAGATKVTAN